MRFLALWLFRFCFLLCFSHGVLSKHSFAFAYALRLHTLPLSLLLVSAVQFLSYFFHNHVGHSAFTMPFCPFVMVLILFFYIIPCFLAPLPPSSWSRMAVEFLPSSGNNKTGHQTKQGGNCVCIKIKGEFCRKVGVMYKMTIFMKKVVQYSDIMCITTILVSSINMSL